MLPSGPNGILASANTSSSSPSGDVFPSSPGASTAESPPPSSVSVTLASIAWVSVFSFPSFFSWVCREEKLLEGGIEAYFTFLKSGRTRSCIGIGDLKGLLRDVKTKMFAFFSSVL